MKTAREFFSQIVSSMSPRGVAVMVLVALAVAAFTTPRHAAAAGGMTGPDILGIRVGMTSEEALAILKARAPKETWQTFSAQLTFQDSRFQSVKLPNGTFRGAVKNRSADSSGNMYIVYLTPTPGKERVAAVTRYQGFNQYTQERPLFDSLVAGLIEKYGKPTLNQSQKGGYARLIWAFDAGGKPRPLTIKPRHAAEGGPCVQGETLPINSKEATGWSFKYQPVGDFNVGGRMNDMPYVAACGDTLVRALVVPAGEFVSSMHVELIGHAVATAGKERAVSLIDAAEAADLARARGAAQKKSKPDI